MKYFKLLILIPLMAIIALGCTDRPPTSDDIQQQQQEKILTVVRGG